MTFRPTMSKEELAVKLSTSMEEFRPAVAALAKDAKRWQFCKLHGFPEFCESHQQWELILNCVVPEDPGVTVSLTFSDQDLDSVIDTAISYIEKAKAKSSAPEQSNG